MNPLNITLLIIVAGVAVGGMVLLAALGRPDNEGLQRIAELIIAGSFGGGVSIGANQLIARNEQRQKDQLTEAWKNHGVE